ncbi:hypothetical protein J7443_11270 [Tropicibacter sp. R15_0]|uniref:Ig-like domain-containing protein n=1 Tax=Tropicibacter sp. R15_0 TaxID=2821101 RepID=UPI001ADC97D8|nr:Ig-like domain-containing protein [Tropicibacter sp. R15_0]MBO9465812.1 hypothetical protein [Tropicibacter sp. R15_0]
MSAIDFVVRTPVGAIERGSVGGANEDFLIDARGGQDISLNLARSELRGYDRAADDLLITLTDGRVIVLEGYFADDGGGSRLFLSSAGELNQVSFVEADGGALFAQYGPTETWGKWSPTDDLIFVEEPRVALDGGVPYDPEGEEVSMLGAGLLGAAGGLGLGGIGAAGLGAAALVGLGGDGDGGGGGGSIDPIVPTVDDPDADTDIGGGDDPSITVTGTGETGSDVVVTIGDETVETVVGEDGTWEAVFEGDDFPEDGVYPDVPVVVTSPDGTVTELDGPSFEVDTTPPALEVSEGTVSVGDFFNGDNHEDGVELSGTAEAGSTLTVTIGEHVETITVGEGGTWSFTFDATVLPAGEYTQDIVITAEDSFGNVTTITEVIQIDTVNEISLTNGPLTGDDLINLTEYSAGVTLVGSSQAGSTIVVTIEGQSQTVTAGDDGSWSVTFDSSMLASGTYSTTAEIVSTDLSGNVVTMTHGFNVDTEASVTVNTADITGDGIVNASEHNGTVTLTGTGEAGATIEVEIDYNTWTTTVQSDGTWSVDIGAGFLPAGTTIANAYVTSTDLAGNVSSVSGAINIDTQIDVAVGTGLVEGDGVINAVEGADGFVLTGVGEAGASVAVSVGGTVLNTVIDASGSWSVNVPAASVPTGETVLNVTAVATDAAGNSATATGTIDVDTYVRNFDFTSTPGGADAVVNAEEASQGLTLTGTTEPGGTVQVTLAGVTVPAMVDANGNWTATFTAGQLPSGEQTLTMTAVSTDLAGNTETISQPVTFDTDAGILTISPAPVEGDDVVNFVEASDGVTLTGTSTPFQAVDVTMNGVTHTVITDASGIWVAPFAAHEITPGTYTANITATITDSAGNTLTRTDSVEVDTEVQNFATSTRPIEGDNVINADEASDGFTLAGTTEPGGTVEVVFNGVTRTATVDNDGNWTVTFSSSEIPSGESVETAIVRTTDAVGNVDDTSVQFVVDTIVNELSVSDAPITADDVINAEEARNGFTLTGQVESGSTVVVTFGGVQHTATVANDGSWSVNIPPSSIPAGTSVETATVTATDLAGNTRSTTTSISIDTDVPQALDWVGDGRTSDGNATDTIRTELTDNEVYIGEVTGSGASTTVNELALSTSDGEPVQIGSELFLPLQTPVSDGSLLVLGSTDDAGNMSSSLLVTEDSSDTLTMTDALASAVSGFNVEAIDLNFAEDTNLTITEDQLAALSANTDTLVVRGGADDSVTITGAQSAGTHTEGGETFNVYTLGDTTLLIDDDITNINTGVV